MVAESGESVLACAQAGGSILIKGATVVTMDPRVPDLPSGDVLIRGREIVSIAEDIAPGDLDGVTIDARGMIAAPGLHDAHRHCWQGQLRRFVADADAEDYFAAVHASVALHYRPEDTYVGTLVSALGALDAGITCLGDFSHNLRSWAHADAAVDALRDSGIRAVFAPCAPPVGAADLEWPQEVERLKTERFAEESATTLRLGAMATRAAGARNTLDAEKLRLARRLGIGVVVDGVAGPESSRIIEELGQAGELGPDVMFVHCNDLSDAAWAQIAGSGAKVCLAPTSDAQLGIGDAVVPIQAVLDRRLTAGLGVDSEAALSPDLFTQMRFLHAVQHMAVHRRRYRGDAHAPTAMPVRDVLALGTVGGADAQGLGRVTGTLTPGKDADVVLVAAESCQSLPHHDAAATLVLATDPSMVRTVFVAGWPKKHRGELLHHDLAAIRRRAAASRTRLLAAVDSDLD